MGFYKLRFSELKKNLQSGKWNNPENLYEMALRVIFCLNIKGKISLPTDRR